MGVRLVPAPPPLPAEQTAHETGPPRAATPPPGGPAPDPVPPALRTGRPRRQPPVRTARSRARDGAPGGAPELDPRQACCMVALAAVEVLAGSRPLAQLARWLTPDVYDGLARRAVLTAPGTRVLDAAAGARDLADPPDPAGPTRRPSVRRVRVHRVDAHTVESSVVVAHADRVRAVAVRLSRSTGRWRASALVVG